jgi:uncharacterized protein (DUF1499 family)
LKHKATIQESFAGFLTLRLNADANLECFRALFFETVIFKESPKMINKRALRWLAPVLIALALAASPATSQCKRPPGNKDDMLAPCPKSPNCVSSEDNAGSARIEPLAFAGPPEAAWECLKRAIQGIGGAIEFESDGYIWAVFKTTVFRFIDDMEFRIDPKNPVVHLRSASRIGYYDFGANRRRTAALRQRFLQEQAQPAVSSAADP